MSKVLSQNLSKRVENLRGLFKIHDIDGFLVRNFEGDNQNAFYLSGFSGTSCVLLITADKNYLITDARYFSRAESEAPCFELVRAPRGQSMLDSINQLIHKASFPENYKLGFESQNLSYDIANKWMSEINAKLVPTTHLVESLRQVKSDDEIALIEQACDVTTRVFEEVSQNIESGMTELEVAYELDMRLRKYGAINNSFPSIVASGPNSSTPHHKTGSRKIQAGDPVILDFGGLFLSGYCSDLTRTVFVPGAKPIAQMLKIYQVVLEANQLVAKTLRPGITWVKYDMVARNYIESCGYGQYFTHGLGHSVGLLVHDPYDYEKYPFEVGCVITNEPGIYVDGLGGVRIEDDMVVTKYGCRALTKAPYLSLN